MTIGADYLNPLFVNGYVCWNGGQVLEASHGVNPADPQAGPYGIDAPVKASAPQTAVIASARSPAASGLGRQVNLSV